MTSRCRYNAGMALQPDDTLCFCFDVSRRKIETFCRRERPAVASQISECLSAGTGCGWCVPLIKQIHAQQCVGQQPWWKRPPEEERGPAGPDVDQLTSEQHRAGRQQYLAEGKGTPPAEAKDA